MNCGNQASQALSVAPAPNPIVVPTTKPTGPPTEPPSVAPPASPATYAVAVEPNLNVKR